jgi:hypothetical protein
VKVINVEETDRVVAAVKLVEKEQGDETAGEPTPPPTESVH